MTAPHPLSAYLSERAQEVEGLLHQALGALRGSTTPRLYQALAYSLEAGGKRLRPILCLAFARACGGGPGGPQYAVEADAACALEFLHTYSLIHDDLPAMDNDDLRRGKPTNHKVFGDALAILAGDGLLTEAFLLLARGEEPSRRALCHELSLGAGPRGMVGGQALDIAPDRPPELGHLTQMHRLKTGALIRAACRMGVTAAGGSPTLLEAAGRYGEAVGLAFQIADDLLDVEATPDAVGKNTGRDAGLGKVTYPALLGVEGARARAQQEVAAAQACLAIFPAHQEPLSELARFALERAA